MIGSRICNKAQSAFIDELPKHNVLVHGRRLELALAAKVEDLYSPALGSEGNDELIPVHDGTICLDGPTDNIVAVLEVNDDDLGGSIVIDLLAHTNVVVGFECLVNSVRTISQRSKQYRRLTHLLKPMEDA